jgi:hypothetical protein
MCGCAPWSKAGGSSRWERPGAERKTARVISRTCWPRSITTRVWWSGRGRWVRGPTRFRSFSTPLEFADTVIRRRRPALPTGYRRIHRRPRRPLRVHRECESSETAEATEGTAVDEHSGVEVDCRTRPLPARTPHHYVHRILAIEDPKHTGLSIIAANGCDLLPLADSVILYCWDVLRPF